MSDKLNRRDVLAGAASFALAAALPAPIARLEFINARAEFMKAWAAYEEAREAAFLTRPQTMAFVRKSDITALFKSPEVRQRRRTRIAAQQAGERVYAPEAANDAEAAMQEEVIAICEQMLGAGDGLRDRYPPTRRLHI